MPKPTTPPQHTRGYPDAVNSSFAPAPLGAWQSHLAAGRLAPPAPAVPETVARREATARLFERIRKGTAA